jgi:hypothetical protein
LQTPAVTAVTEAHSGEAAVGSLRNRAAEEVAADLWSVD